MIEDPVCETCNGEGVVMDMDCYGGPGSTCPIEEIILCPDCNGTGKPDYETFRLHLLMVCATLKV